MYAIELVRINKRRSSRTPAVVPRIISPLGRREVGRSWVRCFQSGLKDDIGLQFDSEYDGRQMHADGARQTPVPQPFRGQ